MPPEKIAVLRVVRMELRLLKPHPRNPRKHPKPGSPAWEALKRSLELFGGSGTTILAAEQTGRRAVATELDPKFCAVILERLSRAGLEIVKLRDGLAAAA